MTGGIVAAAITDLLDLPLRVSQMEAALSRLERMLAEVAERLPKKLITPLEAAKQLGVSLPTIRRRIKDGSLRAVRMGRAWRVDTTSLVPKSDDEIATLAFRARNRSGA